MKPMFLLLSAVAVCLAGCRSEFQGTTVEFEPNRVFAYQMGVQSEQPMEQAVAESQHALADLFGTPDEPKLPDFILEDESLASIVSMENLTRASGDNKEQGRGLYRQHCANCHGVTGDGRGPMAALIDPYPRDYRLGKFKFKGTPIGSKPAKSDISYLIKHGIQGSSMVVIPELSDADIDALTDYVVYLSWRGEVERRLLMESMELFFADGDSLYNPALKDSEDEDDQLIWEDQEFFLEDAVVGVAEQWLDAQEELLEVPERDLSVVPDTAEDVRNALAIAGDSAIKESVARGKLLFVSEKAACAKCHGKEGRGDGQTNDYDEWTKDWAKKFGVEPDDEPAQIPLIARGALPVRKVAPRDFQSGVYRAGNSPEQIYRRIALGIEGTPMPAAAVDSEQIWDLVNFVRSLEVPKVTEEEADGAGTTDRPGLAERTTALPAI